METILVATDLSAASDIAIRQAHERALDGARLAVCHVISEFSPVSGLFPDADEPMSIQFLEFRHWISEEIVNRTVSVTGRKVGDFDVLIENGTAYARIVALAEDRRADLVVVGNRGSTGLTRVLLGSVAEKVVRYSHCPVLVARPSNQIRRILVATDFSESSFPAVAAAGREARRTSAALTILHCIESVSHSYGLELPGMLPSSEERNTELERLRQESESKLEDLLARHELTGERRVVVGPPAASITSVCDELQPDLLVVGTRGRGGLRSVILGSVAETVVRLAPCSVLVVRLAAE